MIDAANPENIPMPAWAHAAGILNLGAPVHLTGECDVMDRVLFCERIARYCWAYDERRIDRLGECFTDDAIWEGNVLGKVPIGPFQGREKILNWLSEFWPHQKDQRRHMLLNTIVEKQAGDTAISLSYLLLLSSTGDALTIESMGFYRTAYRKENDHWYISRLTAGFDKPFWPGSLKMMSAKGRSRHGVGEDS